MSDKLSEFRLFRERMNEHIHEAGNLTVNRFFALDGRAYEPGALDTPTKELLGLVASMVLRCDDCISYHLIRCREEGWSDEELFDAFAVGLIVGGFIPSPLGAITEYAPTLYEISITVGIWALGFLMITVFYKIALSVREGFSK